MRLSDYDASFLYRESAAAPMHGVSIAVLEGELDAEHARAHIEARTRFDTRYRKKLASVPMNLAHPRWVDDPDFDIANHVRSHALPSGTSLDAAVNDILALTTEPLPRDLPLWQTWVVSGVADTTLIAHVVHQTMVTDAGSIDTGEAFLDIQAQPKAAEPPPWQPESPPDPMTLASEAIRENAAKFSAAGQRLTSFKGNQSEMVRRAAETLTRFVAEPVLNAPWNAGRVGKTRLAKWRKYAFADLRKVRNALGGTINDLVLTVVSEAAARYLDAHDVELAGQNLRIMCPVSVRREDAHGARGNRVSSTFPVFAATPGDIAARLRAVRFETETIKQNGEAQALQYLTELAPPTPPFAMLSAQLLAQSAQPAGNLMATLFPALPSFLPAPLVGFNLACTNVPRAQTAQYFCGHRVTDLIAVPTLSENLGFAVTVVTYDGNLYFNLVSDAALMPDLSLMTGFIDEVYDELTALTQRTSAPAAEGAA